MLLNGMCSVRIVRVHRPTVVVYVNDSKFDQNRTMLDGAHTAHNVCAHRFGFSRAQNMTAADKLQFGLNILAFCIRLQDIYMKS